MLGLCSGCSGPDADLLPAYRGVEVPTARLDDPAARARGRDLYLEHCAHCHGARADGRGLRHSAFAGPPADFTSRAWRRRISPRRAFQVVREGSPGTAMPAWKGTLRAEESWDVVAYVLSVAEDRP